MGGWQGKPIEVNSYEHLCRVERQREMALDFIQSLRRNHDAHGGNGQDCWYACPKAMNEDGESACCNHEDVDAGDCTCGADTFNARLDGALIDIRGVAD